MLFIYTYHSECGFTALKLCTLRAHYMKLLLLQGGNVCTVLRLSRFLAHIHYLRWYAHGYGCFFRESLQVKQKL